MFRYLYQKEFTQFSASLDPTEVQEIEQKIHLLDAISEKSNNHIKASTDNNVVVDSKGRLVRLNQADPQMSFNIVKKVDQLNEAKPKGSKDA